MVPHSPRSRWMLGTKEFTKNMKITTLRTDTHFTRSTLSVILCCWGETTSHVWAIVKFVRNWIWNPLSSAVLGCFAPSFYPPEKFVCRKPQPINILIGCYFRKLKDSWICLGGVQPLEGFHQLAQQILQVEDLLHQEAFHSRLLSAGRVNALSRLPPHQDLMLEFWKSMTPRAEEKNCSLMHLKHISTHTHTHTTQHNMMVTVGLSSCSWQNIKTLWALTEGLMWPGKGHIDCADTITTCVDISGGRAFSSKGC